MLPADKAAYPRFLYLDQNKWIALSLASRGHAQNQGEGEAYSALRTAIASRKWIAPISLIHCIESVQSEDPSRRKRLVQFILSESENRAILPHYVIQEREVMVALSKAFKQTPIAPVRPRIIRDGALLSLGAELVVTEGTEEAREELPAIWASPEVAEEFLLDQGQKRPQIHAARNAEAALVQTLTEIRDRAERDLTPDQRFLVEVLSLLQPDLATGQALQRVLTPLGLTPLALATHLGTKERIQQFFESIPTLNVMVKLLLKRDRAARIDKNDTRDLIWLSVALPYANVIVLEKKFASIIRQTGLDKQYGTTILTDLRELPGLLSAA